MRALSLCSGIGGIDLGLSLVIPGYRTAAYCEREPYCQRVLAARMSDGWLDRAPVWPDVTTLSGDIIDCLVSPWNTLPEEGDMGAPRKDFDEAVRLYESGLSVGEVAKYYGRTRQAMWAILRRRGVSFRPQQKAGADNHFFRGGYTSKARANDLLERAMVKGLIVRPDVCETCRTPARPFRDGRSSLHAHHDDYNKPLEVRWLCQLCHHEWHRHHRPVPYKEPREAGVDIIHAGFP